MNDNRLKLQSVAYRNFLSYGNAWTEVDLTIPGTTLIVGEDLDSGTGSANGVGKTVILNAIVYGLFGKPLNKEMKLDSLINNINKKNMEVKLVFSKNGAEYEIHRFRKAKDGTGVKLSKDGNVITPDSVDLTDKMVEEIIGYSYDLFVRIVVFSANHQPFFELPTSGAKKPTQRDIIEELFGLTTLTEMAKELKDQIKEHEQRAGIIHAKIEQIEKEKTRHEQQIKNTKQRIADWETERQTKIARLRKQLASVEGIDFDAERALYEERDRHEIAYKELKSSLKARTTERSTTLAQITKLEKEIKHLHDATCPYCLQKYEGAAEKVDAAEKELQNLNTVIESIDRDLLAFSDKLDELTTKIEDVDSKIKTSDLDQLLKVKNESSTYLERIADLEKEVNPYLDTLEELEKMDLDEAEYTAINELEDTIAHQKFLHKLLTKEDSFVRKKLIDQNIPALNAKLKEYLGDLGLPHKVEFTNTMDASISMMGRPLEYANLSTGQKARVNFALSLSFRSVLQQMFSPVNFGMLDEVLDIGLCPVGVTNAAKLLRKIARQEGVTLFIISHRDELESAFDRTMKIQMKKGFSNIVME